MANDLLESNPITAPTLYEASQDLKAEINPDVRKDNFDQRIRNKYRNGYQIYNVADGIKHIKTVQYFNGHPVRLNIVVINQKVGLILHM